MVVEAADPKGALRVARTYFLSHGVLPPAYALHAAAEIEEDQAVCTRSPHGANNAGGMTHA